LNGFATLLHEIFALHGFTVFLAEKTLTLDGFAAVLDERHGVRVGTGGDE
jgi:hypothetical protein